MVANDGSNDAAIARSLGSLADSLFQRETDFCVLLVRKGATFSFVLSEWIKLKYFVYIYIYILKKKLLFLLKKCHTIIIHFINYNLINKKVNFFDSIICT